MRLFAIRLKSFVLILTAFAVVRPAELRAQATLLLEEPYSYDGTFAGTGHAAVYLSRICAASPTELRRCQPGETGVVISRYHRVAGRDWFAIPLIPYLYAVEKPEQIPLIARILAVADAYDAMCSDRPYRRGMPVERVEEMFQKGAAQQWDAEVIKAYFTSKSDVLKISQEERANLTLDVQQWT